MNMPLWKDIEAKAAKLGVTVEQGLLPWLLKFGDQHADKLVSQRFACSLGVPLIWHWEKTGSDNRSIDTRIVWTCLDLDVLRLRHSSSRKDGHVLHGGLLQIH